MQGGEIIDYVGNINYETENIENLKTSVSTGLENINVILTKLEEHWKDQKSVEYLPKWKTRNEELNQANENCKMETDKYLNNIKEDMKVYNL